MKTNFNIFNNLNESLEEEFERKRTYKKYSAKNRKLNEADKVEVDKDSNKSIRDEKTSRLKRINESHGTNSEIESLANEIYEFYDNDMGTHFDEVLGNEEEVYNYTLAMLENKEENREVLQRILDEIKESEVDNELANKLEKFLNEPSINESSFNDKVKAIKKNLRKDKRTTAKSAQKSAEKIAGSMVKEEVVKINQVEIEPDYLIQDVTTLNQVGNGDVQSPDIEAMLTLVDSALKENYSENWGHIKTLSSKIDENSSYALVDITTPEILKEFEAKGIKDAAIGKSLILERVNDKLVEFKVNSLSGTTKYSKKTSNPQQAIYEWVESEFLQEAKEEKAKELEAARIKTEKETVENYINNRLDLKMEIENIKMFIELSKEVKAQDDMKPAIQKRMYAFAAEVPYNIEVTNKNDKYELKFSNLDQVVEMIFGKEWVKEVTPDNEVVGVIKEGLDYDENGKAYPENFTIGDIEGLYDHNTGMVSWFYSGKGNNRLHTSAKYDELPDEEFPHTDKGKIKAYIKKNFLNESQKLTEAYEQFNIGEIEVVFNPDTYETLYSIPSADVQDKKINLTKVPSVDTPYDTDTIIKSYIETKFGRIPTEEEKEVQDKGEVSEPNSEVSEPNPEEETTQDDINIDVSVEDDSDLTEDELPDEPEENELPNEPEEELPKAETGSAVFMKIRPKQGVSIEDLRGRQLDGDTPTSSYIVVDNLDLSPEEFEDLSSNLSEQRSYLEGIQALDRKNYSFNVIKITSANSTYDLLIDPLGYNYPRYVAIVDKTA